MATIIATPVTSRLPKSTVGMSYWPRRGNQPDVHIDAHSTWLMNVHASRTREKTMRALITTDASAAANSAPRTIFSRRMRAALPRRSAAVRVTVRISEDWST
jgi:hypothetical protein